MLGLRRVLIVVVVACGVAAWPSEGLARVLRVGLSGHSPKIDFTQPDVQAEEGLLLPTAALTLFTRLRSSRAQSIHLYRDAQDALLR
ncbi:MAG: hypothetical protein ACON4T_07985 [Synechococcus sp.]